MARPVTLFTGQWADLKLSDLARKAKSWGYDGLELACWGDHFDPLKGAESPKYCDEKKALLAEHGLKVFAISNHLAGQLVLDPNDFRTDDEGVRARREEPGRQGGVRLHGIADLAVRLLVPAGAEKNDR
jgi:sugar phosphate isomerase/epimerase